MTHTDDRRGVPYTNNKMLSPSLIWSIIVTLAGAILLGVVSFIRLEGAVAANSGEIIHVKELSQQQNEHTREALDDIKKEQSEIKDMLREALKDRE